MEEKTLIPFAVWFAALPPSLAKKALNNLRERPLVLGDRIYPDGVSSLSRALFWGFEWIGSPEGVEYWQSVWAETVKLGI